MPGQGYSHAFLCERGEMRDLGTGEGRYSVGDGISRSGIVAGEGNIAGSYYLRAFVDAGDGPVELPTLNGQWSTAPDVNQHGLVVGYETYRVGDDLFHPAVVWIRG